MGILISLASAVLFGATAVLAARAQRGVGVLAGIVLMMTAQSFVAFVLAVSTGGFRIATIQVVLIFAFIGAMTGVLGNMLFFRAIQLSGPAEAATGKVAAMVVGVAMAMIVLGERAGVLTWVGVCLVAAGIWSLGRQQAETAPGPDGGGGLHGFLFSLAGGFCFALGNLMRKPAIELWPEPFAVATVEPLAAALCLLMWPQVRRELAQVSWSGLGRWLMVGTTAGLGLSAFLTALQMTTLTVVNVITGLEPVFALALTFLLQPAARRFGRRLVIGVAVVTIGVGLIVVAA